MSRRPLVAANWKMHLLRQEAEGYCHELLAGLPSELPADGGADVLVCPSHPLLPAVVAALAGSAVACGGQDVHPEPNGAFTGDVSAAQLVDAGCRWVIVGHSERRRDHQETDALVGRKLAAARRVGLHPLVCLGETLEERRNGLTFTVLERQLTALLPALAGATAADLAFAYEPVWAIGSGETATPAIAQEAHRFLRQQLAHQAGDHLAAGVRILYGGSVKPENAAELATQPDLDGFLVGGASLDVTKFLAIIRGSV